MYTTFLLGNGFDVCLGLNTRYDDFYKNHYLKLPKDKLPDHLKAFRENIQKYVIDKLNKVESEIDWSDLEYALGQYSEKLEDSNHYIDIILDVNKELKEYIQQENERMSLELSKAKKLLKDFTEPDNEHYLSLQDRQIVRSFKKDVGNAESIFFMTFNYTNTLEKILSVADDKSNKPLQNSVGFSVLLKNVLHIHSNLADDPAILVGVNDASQIANTAFRDDPDVLDVIVKPRTNDMFGNGKNSRAEELLRSTHLFVLFGVSIGETDKKWWQEIGGMLAKRTSRVIYFVYDKPGESNPLLLGRKRREYQNKLLKASGFKDSELNNYRSLITIAYNTSYFKV